MDDRADQAHLPATEADGWEGWNKPRIFRAPVSYRIDYCARLVGIESGRGGADGADLTGDGHLQVVAGVLQPVAEALRPCWLRTVAQVFAARIGKLFVFEGCPRWRIAAVVPTDDGRVASVRMTKGSLHDVASLLAISRMLNLTPREADVFALLLDGIPPKRIAQNLSTSVTTVRTQVQSILAKSGHASMRELLWMMACIPSVEQMSVTPVTGAMLQSRPLSMA